MRHRLGRAILCATLALSVTTGCDQQKDVPVVAADAVAPGVENARRALKRNWEPLLEEQLQQAVHAQPIERYFQLKSPPMGLVHRSAILAFYKKNNWMPVFTEHGVPNFRARAVLEAAADAETHALAPEKYLRPSLQRHIRTHGELQRAWSNTPTPVLGTEDWAQVEALLRSDAIARLEKPLPEVLDRLLGLNGHDAAIEGLDRAWQNRVTLKRALDASAALLELAIADAWLTWTYDMSDGYWEKTNPDANKEQQESIRTNALKASLTAVAQATTPAEVQAIADAKVPRFEQYGRLIEARRRYQTMVQNGGWTDVRAVSLARGSSGQVVQDLKVRLQTEGYFTGTINQSFDRELEDAVKSYQETHQMETTGKTSAPFWASLNVSAEDRLAHLELVMQRWRENRIGDDNYYILINIPDFHAEVWRDGVMERRFRIVVGNTQRECRNGKMIYANATPIQSADMTFVVLNPYWTVPQRIVNEELLPAFLKNPAYFEERGYEQVTAANGSIMVRQVPGPGNALGAVKFMFPNVHDTYMHDTPRRNFFEPPTRAFSHGCMRVQDPLDLLEHILVNDGQWDARNIARIREHGREHRMNLKTALPVHSEYFVVRVDDEGRTHFMADLYRHDRERLDMRFTREDSCTPPPRNNNLRLGADGKLMQRNADGTLVEAHEVVPDPLLGIGAPPAGLPAGLPSDMGP